MKLLGLRGGRRPRYVIDSLVCDTWSKYVNVMGRATEFHLYDYTCDHIRHRMEAANEDSKKHVEYLES